MNLDEFEQRLRAQRFQSIPPDWREEVLRAARQVAVTPVRRAAATPLRHWLSEWLWPSPVAWGALGVCWVAVVVLNRAALPSAGELAEARADARLALAYQALVRDFSAMQSGPSARPASPTARPSPRPPNQSQARPNASATLVCYDCSIIPATQELA